LNFEINAFIYDKDIINKISDDFFEDLKNSKEVDLEVFQNRPFIKKWAESVARLFSPIL
jgi:cardiolipin synthase